MTTPTVAIVMVMLCMVATPVFTNAQLSLSDEQIGAITAAINPVLSHVKTPCVPELKMVEKCIAPAEMLPSVLPDLLRFRMDVDPALLDGLCDPECDNLIGDRYKIINDKYSSPNADPTCDGVIALPIGDIDPFPALVNTLQDLLCLKRPDGKRCGDNDVFGATLKASGIEELLQNPPPALAQLIRSAESGETPALGDIIRTATEVLSGDTLTNICTAFSEGGCCTGSLLDMTKALLPHVCLPQASFLMDTVQSLCRPIAPLADACFEPGLDLSVFTPNTNCRDVTSITESVLNLKPLAKSKYMDCTVPAGICPANSCELLFCEVA